MTSDLAAIKRWWKTLGGDGFAVLPPPTRGRYTQSDGHEDAVEFFDERGLPDTTSFAYWQWQSHEGAFDRDGTQIGPLLVHWGGEYDVVKAGLGAGPEGYELADGGPKGAFQLDRVTTRDADGLPDPNDDAGVRQLLEELCEPIDRPTPPLKYRSLTDVEAAWLHARFAESHDLDVKGAVFEVLALRDAETADETDQLQAAWRERYADDLSEWGFWTDVLGSMLQRGHRDVWEVVAEIGPESCRVLQDYPSERAVSVARDFGLGGAAAGVGTWLELYAAVHDLDPVTAAATVGAELNGPSATAAQWSSLESSLARLLFDRWHDAAPKGFPTWRLANLRGALADQLPDALRSTAAREVRDVTTLLREQVDALGGAQIYPGYGAAELAADLDRFAEIAPSLLERTGPDLTQYEGGLNDTWNDYRELSTGDIAWLHARVADPQTEMQGLGFCLELLYAHGEGTVDDLDALRKRWKKVLTKAYRTTYVEWRHPLVTLTCLAHDLGDPLAAELDAWWAKPTPKWKTNLRYLTLLGAPSEDKAAELWSYVESRADDEGQLMTWVLMRARLDDVRPVDVADGLLGKGFRDYVLHRVLIGVADPQQPLWHYSIGDSVGWWQRIVQVADDPTVSPAAREVALEAARGHWIIEYPDRVHGVLPADIAAAQSWLAGK